MLGFSTLENLCGEFPVGNKYFWSLFCLSKSSKSDTLNADWLFRYFYVLKFWLRKPSVRVHMREQNLAEGYNNNTDTF